MQEFRTKHFQKKCKNKMSCLHAGIKNKTFSEETKEQNVVYMLEFRTKHFQKKLLSTWKSFEHAHYSQKGKCRASEWLQDQRTGTKKLLSMQIAVKKLLFTWKSFEHAHYPQKGLCRASEWSQDARTCTKKMFSRVKSRCTPSFDQKTPDVYFHLNLHKWYDQSSAYSYDP